MAGLVDGNPGFRVNRFQNSSITYFLHDPASTLDSGLPSVSDPNVVDPYPVGPKLIGLLDPDP